MAVPRPKATRPKRVHPEARLPECRPARSMAAGPGDGTRQWEKRRQRVKPSQSSSSCCYSLTNMAAADAAAACSGRAPSRSRGNTSGPSRSHSSIFSSKQSLLREGIRPRIPQLASCGKAEAEMRAGGWRGTGRAGRKFAAAGPARPEPGW